MMLVFDEHNLKETAEAVLALNENARDHYDPLSLCNFMENLANQHLRDKPSYISTLGFVLTSFVGFDKKMHIKACITSSIVLHYLKVEA